MNIRDLNPTLSRTADALEVIASSETLLKTRAQNALNAMNTPYTNAKALIQLMQDAQRLRYMDAAGIGSKEKSIAYLDETSSLNWQDIPSLPIEDAQQIKVAELFLQSPPPKPDATNLIMAAKHAPLITETIVDGYVKSGQDFNIKLSEEDWMVRLSNVAKPRNAKKAGKIHRELFERADKAVQISAAFGGWDEGLEGEKARKNWSALHEADPTFDQRITSDENGFILTIIPSEIDAKLDGMKYHAYLQKFFELCDQPWDAIGKAQNALAEKFDRARKVVITSNEGTNLELNIEGMTFATDLMRANIPGSEFFSAPKRDGVNGVFVAKGKFLPSNANAKAGKHIEDITLRFKDGKVVEAKAKKGEDLLNDMLDRDEGARRVGELGIGTNPGLKTHVTNPLLVEKIGGSFHLALGASYEFKQVDGRPVNIDNGNRSDIHWDITSMLKGRGGKIYLDGELVQENGQWLAPELEVLNKGWKAIPEKERPNYWTNRIREEQQKGRESGFSARAV